MFVFTKNCLIIKYIKYNKMKLYIFKSSVYVQYGCYIRLILYQIKYEVLDLIKCMLSIVSFFLFFLFLALLFYL